MDHVVVRKLWGCSVLLGGILLAVSGTVSGEKLHSRYKRGWMMPGTLWCGAGSAAENYTNLGTFHAADLCCREHDFCSHQIQAFEFLYGMRNYRMHTISHCDCDQSFRRCLHSFNDTVSTLVAIMYFNILEMPCFILKEEEQCVEWHWWGGCKSSGWVPKAELQKQAAFNSTHPEDMLPTALSLPNDRQTATTSSSLNGTEILDPSSHKVMLTTLSPDDTANRRHIKKGRNRKTARARKEMGEHDSPVLKRKNKGERRRASQRLRNGDSQSRSSHDRLQLGRGDNEIFTTRDHRGLRKKERPGLKKKKQTDSCSSFKFRVTKGRPRVI